MKIQRKKKLYNQNSGLTYITKKKLYKLTNKQEVDRREKYYKY